MLLIVDIGLLLPQVADPVEDGHIRHAHAEHRARDDIDYDVDVRLGDAEGKRYRLDPLPVRVRREMEIGVLGADHAADSIVSNTSGRKQRRSYSTRSEEHTSEQHSLLR